MALSTYVKISTVTNLSDARYAAGMGVDALGFRLEEGQPGYVTPVQFHGITEWLAGVALVGEFLGTDTAVIHEIAKEYPLDYVQVESEEMLSDLQSLSAKLIVRVNPESIEGREDLEDYLSQLCKQVDWVLIEPEGDYSNLPLKDQLTALNLPLVIGFDVSESTLGSLSTGVKGLALKGGEEERPGFKDYEEMMDILEALEVDN